MPHLVVSAGKPYLVMQPERRADLERLCSRLGSRGVSVDLQVANYIPGRRGVSFNQPEAIVFYILGVASSTVISSLVGDIYKAARDWAIARFKSKVEKNPNGLHRPETFTIYGPDNEVLKTWTIDDDGEHER
jgi:hypothetical protein